MFKDKQVVKILTIRKIFINTTNNTFIKDLNHG